MSCIIEGCDNQIENSDTGLCASHGLASRKAAKQALKEKKVYKIPPISKKLAKERKQYSGPGGSREQHLTEHPNCQIKLLGCEGMATQVHHAAKRGKNLNNRETFMSACGHCHEIVEFVLSAKDRRELGLLR